MAFLNYIYCIIYILNRYDYQTLDYDIMMIKLFHPVEVTQAVAPIPLPTGCPIGGLPCSVSGWGDIDISDEGVCNSDLGILNTQPLQLQ